MCSSLSVALLAVGTAVALGGADLIAVTDGLNYNAGSQVSIRFEPRMMRTSHAAIRYAGEERPAVKDIELQVKDGEFAPLWKIPFDARTGRYEVDVDGVRNATSFAVHRKLARVTHVELERTFYTNGDPIH